MSKYVNLTSTKNTKLFTIYIYVIIYNRENLLNKGDYMKVLRKKLKKVNLAKKILYFLAIILYIGTYAYFVYGILKLKGIENLIRGLVIGFFGLWLIIYILCGLLTMISKKTKTFIFISIITLIFCPVFGISSYYINKVYGSIKNINNETLTYTTNLIALKETEFNNTHSIGMIESEADIEGNILAKALIEKYSLSNKIETFEDYHSMINALYKGKIGGCFVSSNYAINLGGEEYEDTLSDGTKLPLSERVKVLYEHSETRKNEDVTVLNTNKSKKLTEPFTALIMGVDSTINGLTANQAFNGDTLIMVTFNPNTLTTTMFSIPRDMYVPIACNHNRYAKINSSAAYGSSCVINTVQQLTGIDIDYYVKINFIGVVDLVNVLGGVTVDVEEPDFPTNSGIVCGKNRICEQNSLRQFGKNMIYIDSGVQKLNGEQALAYARNRHQFAASDIARNQHQQQIIEAVAQQIKELRSLKDFENVLDTVSNNIETNMTPEQILSFYNVGKDMLLNSSTSTLSISKTYLSYYPLPVYLPNSGMVTSALGYYPESLDAIIKLMKVNLELEKETPTKTFSISYNEEYTTPIVGKGLTGGQKLETMPSFIGDNEYEANTWCQLKGLSCSFESVTSSEEYGTIINQSAHQQELLKSLGNIKFQVSNGLGKPDNNDDDNDDEDDKNNDDKDKDDDNKDNNDNDKPSNPDKEEPDKKPEEPEVPIPGGPGEENTTE